MDHTTKQLHHCVAIIVQLNKMYSTAQGEEMHRILHAVQCEIVNLIPKNPRLTSVASLYVGITKINDVNERLLHNEYSSELLDRIRKFISELMTSGDCKTKIHDYIETIDTDS